MSKTIDTLIEALYANARQFGSGVALVLRPSEVGELHSDHLTWAQLGGCVTTLARELLVQSPSDRHLIHQVNNTAADVVIALACQSAGIVEVPIDPDAGERFAESCRKRIGGIWLDEDTKTGLVGRAFMERCDQSSNLLNGPVSNLKSDDDALVLWTSGTSGDPKGVVLSHRSQMLNAKAKLRAVPQSRSDRRLTVLSIAHGYARTCDLGTWILSGCTLAIAKGFAGWSEFHDRFSPTLCNMVPSLAQRVCDSDFVPASLKLLGCGGAAMTVDRFEQWRRRGVTVIQGYGLTESGPVIASQTPEDSIAGHVGGFVEGWEHRIEQHRTEQGRLFVRGAQLMSRYWNDEAATAARIDSDGWMDTGDLVEFGKDEFGQNNGQLRILGRVDDRIVLANGHKVDPHGLEQRFAAVDGVRTAVVCKSSDQLGVELWVEFEAVAESVAPLEKVIATSPRWERPRAIKRLSIPEAQRQHLFNRKGAIRRHAMLGFLKRATGSG